MILFSFYLSSLLGRAGRYVEAKEGIVICSQSSEVIIFQATLHTAFIKAHKLTDIGMYFLDSKTRAQTNLKFLTKFI